MQIYVYIGVFWLAFGLILHHMVLAPVGTLDGTRSCALV